MTPSEVLNEDWVVIGCLHRGPVRCFKGRLLGHRPLLQALSSGLKVRADAFELLSTAVILVLDRGEGRNAEPSRSPRDSLALIWASARTCRMKAGISAAFRRSATADE